MMKVTPRLSQTLSVDTNVSYSLDMSKFPGLDDPQYKSQPALLIAGSSQRQLGTMDIIPSPTVDLLGSQEDILEDILSVIKNHGADIDRRPITSDYTATAQQNLQQSNYQQIQPVYQPVNTPVSSLLHNKDKPSAVGDNNMSRYAMDMIFHNLIYPDVSHGHTFNLDTLIQSAPMGQALRSAAPTGDYINRLNTITGNMVGLPSASSLRYGKRKRVSCDTPRDPEDTKRVRCDRTYLSQGAWNNNVSNMTYHPRRLVLS